MTAVAVSESGAQRAARDGMLVARRNLTRLARTPSSIASAIVFPLIFMFGFRAVLGRSLAAQGIDAAQYLPPVVMVQAMFFSAIGSAFFLADDKVAGILDRCRSLPINRWAPLVGRLLADLARSASSLVVLVAVAVATGFRFQAGVPAAVGFVGLALLFSTAAAAGCALVGLRAASPQVAASTLFLPYLPLLMLSTGFVPIDGFPGWLQPFVRWQPVSSTVEAMRALTDGGPTATPLTRAVAVLAALLTVFGALATRTFRRLP